MVFSARISGRREQALMDTGASHNFIAASFAEMLGLKPAPAGPSLSQVEVAGQTTLPIQGSVKVPLRIGALSDTVTALVIPDLIRGVALILGESWMIHRKADILFSSMKCTLTSPTGERLTLRPCGLQNSEPQTLVADTPLDDADAAAELAALCSSVQLQANDTNAHLFISAREAERELKRGGHAMMLLVRQAPDTPHDTVPRLATLQSLAPELGLMSPQQLDHLLAKWKHVLQEPPAGTEPQERDVGRIIELEPGKIPYRPPRRLSPAEYEVVQNMVSDALRRGWIAPSKSPFGSPLMFVAKKGGGLRCVQDLRMVNKHTVKIRFPMPNIAELIDRLRDATVFSSIDLFSGYYQIKLHPEDCPKTAFSTPLGHYEFKVLAQGLVNAPAQFQSIMTQVFAPYINKFVVIYLDDILVFSKTPEEHAQHLDTVLSVLAENGFYARKDKCHWNQPKVKYLGHVVGRNMVAMDPDKVSVIRDWPQPTTPTELRSFLGLANFFRKHVQGYATLSACLHDLTKPSVKFEWTASHSTAFEHLKWALQTAPILTIPDFNKPFEVWSDASLLGTGAMLMQEGKVVAYTSKKFDSAQKNYTTTDQELLGVFNALSTWQCYLEGLPEDRVTVCTDHHPLVYLQTQPTLSRRQARWMEFMSRFAFKWKYVPGRTNVADPVSRNPNLAAVLLSTAVTAATNQVGKNKRKQPASDRRVQEPTLLEKIKQAYAHDSKFRDPNYTSTLTQTTLGLWLSEGKIVVPDSPTLRKQVIEEHHAPAYSGHVGINRTAELVMRTFTWPGLRDDVQAYVQTCHQCQTTKPRNTKEPGLAQSVEIPTRPWECVSTDLITQLPTTKAGHDAIMVFVDKLTKMTHIAPCHTDISAEEWARAFFHHVVRLHGLPKKMLSDRDSRFTGKFMTALCDLLGTRQAFSTSFHPRTDGQTERMNRTLEDMLRAYVSPSHDDWDEHLDAAEFAINNARQGSTKATPFYLNYGQHPLTPVTVDADSDVPSAKAYAAEMEANIWRARECIEVAQARQRTQTDKKRTPVTYTVGQQVLLSTRNIKLKSPGAAKLMPKYIGPFEIEKLIGPVAVQLKLLPAMLIHKVFHVNLIKPYKAGDHVPPPPCGYELDGSPVWRVKEITASKEVPKSKKHKATMKYLCSWEGYGPEHDEWVLAKDILDNTLIVDFKKRQAASEAAKTQRKGQKRKRARN
jgi:hypothetical protein